MVSAYHPRPELGHFVHKIILAHYRLDKMQPKPVTPLPPQPEHCLYFYPYDKVLRSSPVKPSAEELPRSIVVGPKLHRVDLTMGYNSLAIIVRFHPGGLYRFLKIPMNEICNQSVDADLLFGGEIDQVTEKLNNAADYDTMIQIVEEFLLKKSKTIKNSLQVDEALISMLHHRNTINVDALAKNACVSIRQLERQFKERIGISPKVFVRLMRFSKAWTMKENNPGFSWLQIAHACDYTDQMHMIRDFRDFTGATPGALQTDSAKSPLRLQDNSF